MDAGKMRTESDVIAVALGLGAREIPGWSASEDKIATGLPKAAPRIIRDIRDQIKAGHDPLGDLFCSIRQPAERRTNGATFTPTAIVQAMTEWAASHGPADRIIDPGVGSGRFLLSAARKFKKANLIGIEIDPFPAILARANLAVQELQTRSQIILSDYRSFDLATIPGRTLFLGNPPYVRHHLIPTAWKEWLVTNASKRGILASQLAGLHAHFFLATVLKSAPTDFGAFITAAEWLDVNYGHLVRELFLNDLGGRRIVVIEPKAMPFPDAATTAAITYFEIGSKQKTIKLKRVETVAELKESNGNHVVRRERLESEERWSHLTHALRKEPAGYVELGELCRVHRGQVTGANKLWIEGDHSQGLPDSVLFPTITRAKELFAAGSVLTDTSRLKRVIDLPHDLDVFGSSIRKIIDKFLRHARNLGAHLGYVAANRKSWWSVGLKEPAPILATYMARRPPAFVRNSAEARHINIAHGLYPREPLNELVMQNLVNYLSTAIRLTAGRTYAGGLTKFEPREMERLLVPDIDILSRIET